MPDLFLELLCEEIPARMQARAAKDLETAIVQKFLDAGLKFQDAQNFVTPRRMVVHIIGLPPQQPDQSEERKGPRVSAPQQAIDGFVKSAGLSSIDEADVVSDPKKGDFYVARIEKKGQETGDFIECFMPDVLSQFSWPKSMRWGSKSTRWVRPLRNIVCTFGPETEEPRVLEFSFADIESNNRVSGHRFLAPDQVKIKRYQDYEAHMRQAHVMLDRELRKGTILHDARQLAFAQGLELVEDQGLLEEVTGLVEWPFVMMGNFSDDFLELPDEVIQTAIRQHQKCFVCRDAKSGSLSNKFILTANIPGADGGNAIIHGNERVIAARLSDALFFWQTDLKVPLEDRLARLENVVFHEKIGSQMERVNALQEIAGRLSDRLGFETDKAIRAAKLAKADLATEMVYEFGELQGLIGHIYAIKQGENAEIAEAIESHYKPLGPTDRLPHSNTAIAVALADKLQILTAFWSIGEIPTGSKDPFALRRAALGVIRIILEHGLRVPLSELFQLAQPDFAQSEALSAFFMDRYKVYLRDQGLSADLIQSIFMLEATSTCNDLCDIKARLDALQAFIQSDQAEDLLAGFKRASNILSAEEKKDGQSATCDVEPSLLSEQAEKALYSELSNVLADTEIAIEQEDYGVAMRALSKLRSPLDRFFEDVIVNADDEKIRKNRLALINSVRDASLRIADFSQLSGS